MKPTRRIRLRDCRRVLLDFVNAKDPEKAARSFVENLEDVCDCTIPKPEVVERQYKLLRKLFDELNNSTSFLESETIHNYTAFYTSIRPAIEVQYDGSLGENPLHEEERHFAFNEILTYCVIQFFKVERNVKLIHKCEYEKCGLYFVAKRVKKKGEGGIRFCSDKCRYNFHNKLKVESGEIKEFKRTKREEKDPEKKKDIPLSYYGYKDPDGIDRRKKKRAKKSNQLLHANLKKP